MTPEELIARIKQAIGEPEFPTVDAFAIADAERKLGFSLPPLLKQLYLQVGNGGFGPGATLIGLEGGAKDDIGLHLVENYHKRRRWSGSTYHYKGQTFSTWPEKLLETFDCPCNIYICLDCSLPEAPVYVYDANVDEDAVQPILLFKDNLFDWLAAPFFGIDLWEEMEQLTAQLDDPNADWS